MNNEEEYKKIIANVGNDITYETAMSLIDKIESENPFITFSIKRFDIQVLKQESNGSTKTISKRDYSNVVNAKREMFLWGAILDVVFNHKL